MGRVNLGTARIVIILALAVGGIAVLANGFASGTVVPPPSGGGSETTSPSESSPTSSPSQPPKETPSPQIEGVLIAVFNGTNETGLAAEVQQLLEADGYVAAQDPADADPKPVPKTIVYFRGGADAAQNRSNARYIADTYFDGAKVSLLDQELAVDIAADAQAIIIVGVDYVGAPAGETGGG
jgi:LytR cell envelope-related transcriptional attenuator